MQSKDVLDAESNDRLMAALFADEDEVTDERSKDVPSHQQLDLDDDGDPLLLRFVYVDEPSCIGCTFCADVARNTFYMNEDAGRARVFYQGGDDPEVVQEAIDTCPVMCISYVDHEDLVILESEREGMTINPASIGVPATWSVSMNSLPPTKAKLGRGGGCSLTTCNNCPSRGCKECPMYGVGLNPIYIARLEEKEAKKEASGEAAREREEATNAEKLGALFQPPTDLNGVVVPAGREVDVLSTEEPSSATFDALFGAPAGFGDDPFGDDEGMLPLGVASAVGGAEADARRAVLEAEADVARRLQEAEAAAEEERWRLEAIAEVKAEEEEAERRAAEERERAAAEAAERMARDKEARLLAEAEAEERRVEEAKQAVETLAALPAAPLTDFGLPALVAAKLVSSKNWSTFKFATPAVQQIALNAIDHHIEALVQAEERAKATGLPCRDELRASEARRRELKDERVALE